MIAIISSSISAVVVIILLMPAIQADNDMEATTPAENILDESMEHRGTKKFGDKCTETQECGFRGSICDPNKKSCQCRGEFEATNHFDLCGKAVKINESCQFQEQCEAALLQTDCKDGKCACIFEMVPVIEGGVWMCTYSPKPTESPHQIDPAMIGILAGMALMFIIICVVLRLFSRARWRENRSIFNTPNPRLMNASLLQHHKNERRGSKGSVRGPSRAPSVSSLRPQSPIVSQGSKNSRSNSRGSNTSAKDRSPTKHVNNMPESVFIDTTQNA